MDQTSLFESYVGVEDDSCSPCGIHIHKERCDECYICKAMLHSIATEPLSERAAQWNYDAHRRVNGFLSRKRGRVPGNLAAMNRR